MGIDDTRDETDKKVGAELTHYLDNLPVEGEDDGWLRVRREVYSPCSRVTSRSRIRLGVAAIVLVVGLITLRAPSVSAWSWGFLNTYFVKLPGPLRNIVTVFIPQKAPELPKNVNAEKKMKALFSAISFRPMIIRGDAGGWVLTDLGVETGEAGGMITLRYKNESGTVLTLEEESVRGPRSSATFYDDDDTIVTEVTIRGSEISILCHKSGQANVWWIEQGLALYLNGQSDADAVADFIGRLVLYSGGQ